MKNRPYLEPVGISGQCHVWGWPSSTALQQGSKGWTRFDTNGNKPGCVDDMWRGEKRTCSAAWWGTLSQVFPFTLLFLMSFYLSLNSLVSISPLKKYSLIWERGRGREREIGLLFYNIFMHSLVYTCMWPDWGIRPTTLAYLNNALTNWATWPGPSISPFKMCHLWRVCMGPGLRTQSPWPNPFPPNDQHESIEM